MVIYQAPTGSSVFQLSCGARRVVTNFGPCMQIKSFSFHVTPLIVSQSFYTDQTSNHSPISRCLNFFSLRSPYLLAVNILCHPPNNQIMLIDSNVRSILCQNPKRQITSVYHKSAAVATDLPVDFSCGGPELAAVALDVKRPLKLQKNCIPGITQRSKVPCSRFVYTSISSAASCRTFV